MQEGFLEKETGTNGEVCWELRWGDSLWIQGLLSPGTGGFWEGWTGLVASGESMLALEVAVPSCPPPSPPHFARLPSGPLVPRL